MLQMRNLTRILTEAGTRQLSPNVLLFPRTTANEAILMDNVEIFQKNEFDFEIDSNVLTEQLSHSVFRRYWWLVLLIGTLSNDDVKKTNLRSFKVNRVYLNPLNMSNTGDFSWNLILKDFIQVKKEEGKFVVVCPRPP